MEQLSSNRFKLLKFKAQKAVKTRKKKQIREKMSEQYLKCKNFFFDIRSFLFNKGKKR